jgi:tRNA-splicing ligase RtcB
MTAMRVETPPRARAGTAAGDKLTVLAADRPPDPALVARLERIAELPFVAGVLALPDLHQKGNAEVPSSISITTVDTIVPEFSSVAVNDGMGIIATDVDARGMSPARVLDFFAAMNAHAATHVLHANRYSLTAPQLVRAALEGGRAGAAFYGLDATTPARMEGGGAVPVPGGDAAWDHAVPALLKGSRVGRSEMGLNFGGNHFLELQVVDEVFDPVLAASWGVAENRVLAMYHLGPGPFGATLLHHYTRRRSMNAARAPWFFLSKLLHHYGPDGGAPRASLGARWSHHFRRNGHTGFAAESPAGLALRQALAMATNFGFAYRAATIAAVRDALQSAVSPDAHAALVCDVMHNSILPATGGTAWVARHNTCRIVPDAPAIVAGMHDVPSYLCVGGSPRTAGLNAYDHGAGQWIEAWRHTGRLVPGETTMTRVRMKRGPGPVARRVDTLPVRTPEPVARLVSTLEQQDMIHPVARLRPIATLKN